MLDKKNLAFVTLAIRAQIQLAEKFLDPAWRQQITADTSDGEIELAGKAYEDRNHQAIQYRDGLRALQAIEELCEKRGWVFFNAQAPDGQVLKFDPMREREGIYIKRKRRKPARY